MNPFDVRSVKAYLGIKGTANDEQIEVLIPSTIAFISRQIKKEIDVWEVEADLGFTIAKFVEYFMNPVGVASYSLSRESTTYSDGLPSYLMNMLEPFKDDGSGSGSMKVINLF